MKRCASSLVLSIGVASAALAADLPAPTLSPIYVPTLPPVYNWTGFYIGGNLGGGLSTSSFSDPLGNVFAESNGGGTFLGGGQIGINYQFWGGVVIGAEADFDWLPNTNTAISTLANPPGMNTGSTATLTINNRWLTSVTGRVGYAFDRVLFYGKGGGAWVGSNNPTVAVDGAPVTIATSNSNLGWTGGLGVEWAFWGNWSARFEYDFVGLNSQAFTIPASVGGLPAGDQFSSSNRNIQMGNVGLNYKFGGW
jgi:outer membrane immunogenic protein